MGRVLRAGGQWAVLVVLAGWFAGLATQYLPVVRWQASPTSIYFNAASSIVGWALVRLGFARIATRAVS